MKKVLHVSTECFPAAKAGGMGDVVGALPFYLPKFGFEASVVIPKYKLNWFSGHKFEIVYQGSFEMDQETIHFAIEKLIGNSLSYPFFCIDIPGKFDRNSIYLNERGVGFHDEIERNLSFQRSVCEWLTHGKQKFELIHCHDHQTSFIPFFMLYQPELKAYVNIPSYYTIHNAVYNSVYEWNAIFKFPIVDDRYKKLLDWYGRIDGFATALKCAWQVNTVAPNYMKEIMQSHHSLSGLLRQEAAKCKGILNGIDAEMWDPSKDEYLSDQLSGSWAVFKSANKDKLLGNSQIKRNEPLTGFVGRFADQKGADVLFDAMERTILLGLKMNYYILGSGDQSLEWRLQNLHDRFPDRVACYIGYNEEVAHTVYAGCDFLAMPSRFEPCGLNQMFAMRYGTVPIVHATGGLVDTVPDYTEGGNGIQFYAVTADAVLGGLMRGIDLYFHQEFFQKFCQYISQIDWSWDKSAKEYTDDYQNLILIGEKQRKSRKA